MARPSLSTRSAICRSCFSNGVVASSDEHHDLGEADGAERVADGELLELAVDPRLAAKPGGVEDPEMAVAPAPVDGDRVAGDPGLGAGQQPLLADEAVDQRRLAGIRPPDHGDLDGSAFGVFRLLVLLFVRRRGRQRSRRGGRPCPRRARPRSPPARRGRGSRRRARRSPLPVPRPCWRRGSPACRLRGGASAKCASTGVTPARASMTKIEASASAIAALGLRHHPAGEAFGASPRRGRRCRWR